MSELMPTFKAHVWTVRDPFHPLKGREIAEIGKPCPIADLAPATRQPFIILRNGEAVLRADWSQPVADGDLLAVVLLPQGGDDSDIGRIVLMIVVAVLSYYTAGAVGAAYGSGWGAAAGAAVGMVGSMIVNALLPPPSLGSSGNGFSLQSSPTYNLAAQGNMARLEQAIPIQYGRVKIYPDFAAAPFLEYAGNEQYLYQLFVIGVGEYEIEAIRIEDTAIANFEEVEYQIVQPGGTLTLFPSAVATSTEVAGQELLQSNIVGPFTANEAGTTANYLAVDVVASRGLYGLSGSVLTTKSITFRVDARAIDDDGVATGAWVTLATETVSGATATPQRYSFRYGVTPGRYEVRVERTSAKDTSSSAGHELDWVGLRAYLIDDASFGDVTLLAVKIRATNNLSQQASRKFNVVCTRKLYQWNGAAWTGPTATRSIAWALVDACQTVGLPDNRIDIDGLLALDAEWAARGDRFDGRFDSTGTFWDALTRIARAGRAKPFMQGGIVHFRRDAAVTLPVALYSMRNIVRNSFSMEFITPTEDTADSVQVTYFDNSTWKPRRLTCALPGSTTDKPAKIELFGVTDREQAYREGIYYAAANRYRRTLIKFTTEMEGFIPSYGDLVAVSHDMPQWGQFAEITAWDEAALTATLSEPVSFDAGTHYCALRRRDGGVDGPHVVTSGAAANQIVFAEPPGITPYIGQEEERTHIAFGWGATWSQLARVISVKPKDETTVELICINEDPSVHSADAGVLAPPVNASQLPATPAAPVIEGLRAKSATGDVDQMLISWQPAPGAEYYLVEQSADGSTWTRSGETRAANFTTRALYGSQTIVRVAAVGSLRGSWAQVSFVLESDYMWNANPATLMWSVNTNLMWT
mgnify:CR=1 FL=1